MKTQFALLSIVALLVGCGGGGGGGGDDFATNNSDLEGFWGGTHVNSQPIQSDSIYLLFENASSSGIQITTFLLQNNSNCYDRDTERLERVDENKYEDSAGDIATLTVQNDVLTFLADDISVASKPVVEISVQDLPICTTKISSKNSLSITKNILEALRD